MASIDKLKSLIMGFSQIADSVSGALADDGKISGFGEWSGILFVAGSHWKIISQFNQIYNEVKDIDDQERDQLTQHFAAAWSIANPVAEKRWEAVFKMLCSTAVFYRDWQSSTAAPVAL